jgi:prepilin-type N-terminal cleavage/methylation domain-containing protein
MNERGFTIVEVIAALVILALGILALSSSTARLTRISLDAEQRAMALQAVEDRLARVRLHPVYPQLDSAFSESGAAVDGLPGFTRDTDIQRYVLPGNPQGKFIDYTRITVTVDGPGLEDPFSRSVTVGAF